MRSLVRALSSVASWGINDRTPSLEASQIRFTNIMLLGLLIASLGQTTALFWTGARDAALINSTAPLVFGSGLLLMKLGYTVSARLLVLTVAYFAGYVIAAILGPRSYFQMILLFASSLSMSFFTLDEWKCMLYGLLLPIGSFAALELTDFAPVPGTHRADLSASAYTILRVSTVSIVWLLIIGLFIYHVRARKRSQEQLISAAKLVALGQMAAGIAHEVNNPLSSIVSDVQLLASLAAKGDVPAEKASRLANRSLRTSTRIAAIVRGLLTLSRDSSRDPLAKVQVRKLIEVTLDYCRARMESAGIELRVTEIDPSLEVLGREAQLSEVLLNILNNAQDATVELAERWVRVAVHASATQVEISVTDSGRGISPEVRRRMFDPFFTSKPVGKGTGLGLSVSQAIVNVHKGQLAYDASTGRTRFVIQLPRA